MIGLPIARVLGVEIRVQLGWVIVIALIASIAVARIEDIAPHVGTPARWFLGGIVAGGFFASAVAHDLAHALVARRHGVLVQAIVVSFFGGATPLDPTATDASSDLRIAVSGPALSVGLGVALAAGAAAAAATNQTTLESVVFVLAVLAVLNLLLGLVNLVPAYPMDGGRIVRAITWRRTRDERAGWLAAATSGRLTGIAAAAAGFVVMLQGDVANGAMVALSGWFLTLSARSIVERVRFEELVADLRVDDVMERDVPTVDPRLTVDTFASQLLDGDVPLTAVPAVHEDRLVGLLGVRQVRSIPEARRLETRVQDAMIPRERLTVVRTGTRLLDAVAALQRSNLDGLPVLDGERLIGVFTRRSLALALQARTGGDRPTEDGLRSDGR